MRRSTGVVEPLKFCDPRDGPALGLFENSKYPSCCCPLQLHDLILLYTDGVYEVEGPGSDEFGQDRLLHVIRRNARLNTDALLDTVLTEVQAFSGTTEFEDDVCLVAVEVARLGV